MPIQTTPGEVTVGTLVVGDGPVGNNLVQDIDTAVRYAVFLVNPGGDIVTDAETAPGTYTVHRVRAGTDTEITAATAASEAAGVISASVDFSDGSWADADLGYIEFSGITATLNTVTTELPVLRKDFRVTAAGTSTDNNVPSADSTANVLVRDVAGNKTDVARTTVGTTRSLMSYLKGVLNQIAILVARGAAGATETNGPFSYLDAGGEQDVHESTAVTRRRASLVFNNQNMTQTGSFRFFIKTDGTTYDLDTTSAVTISAGDDRVFRIEVVTNQNYKLTYEEDVDETAARAIDFHVIEEPLE